MYAEDEPAMKRNEAVLNELRGKLYTREANDKSPDNFKYLLALIQTSQNQKQTNTGGLAKFTEVKSWCKCHVSSYCRHTRSPN